MLWPKKNSYKEFDNEKKFLRLVRSEQLIKFVAILIPDVCIISGRHICTPRMSTNMASP